jgi:large subunit ribosomal protein L30
MIAVVRLRGSIKTSKEIKDTLKMLQLNRVNTMILIEKNESMVGMIKKVDNFVAWGEISDELLGELKNKFTNKKIRLKPPKGGLKSIKKRFPKGNLGYNGEKINDLIKRMM